MKNQIFICMWKTFPSSSSSWILRQLSYDKVDENGKVSCLHQQCPSDEFGVGDFMASHFDRHYRGKCCLTYCFNKPEDK